MKDPETLQTLQIGIRELNPALNHPALKHLVDALRMQHGQSVAAVLFYGSCLRSGDPYDGLIDLYLLVDDYRHIRQGRLKAIWNWLLPPNVFYAEYPYDQQMVRCKYAILSLHDLKTGTSKRWFHSYLWGRFCQPTAIAWCRDAQARDMVENSLAQSLVTFLNRALPSIPVCGSVSSLWTDGLQLSYATELRPESSARAAQLADSNRQYYLQITRLAAPLLQHKLQIDEHDQYLSSISNKARKISDAGWALRRIQGKFLSVARLIKALFTFDGGLDYAAWKLERHSGQKIEIPERVRRYPLIFIWGLFWNLYRRGIFR